jgi:hypothetical protein
MSTNHDLSADPYPLRKGTDLAVGERDAAVGPVEIAVDV